MHAAVMLFIVALYFPAAGWAETNPARLVVFRPPPVQPQTVLGLPRERFRSGL